MCLYRKISVTTGPTWFACTLAYYKSMEGLKSQAYLKEVVPRNIPFQKDIFTFFLKLK